MEVLLRIGEFMKILFITLVDIRDINEPGIYTDLLKEFANKGHNITCVSPIERRNWRNNVILSTYKNIVIEKVKIGNITKTNLIEKSISTTTIDYLLSNKVRAIMKNEVFDLVLYTTPPITLIKTLKTIKKNNPTAIKYLLLKDIFPQNAVDLSMINQNGFIYRYFRNKESKLYEISDYIGCMTSNNKNYLLENNKSISPSKVNIVPNSIYVDQVDKNNIDGIKKKYCIPKNKYIFIYGGNLGKPQGLDIFINSLDELENNPDIFFLLIGSGTEYNRLQEVINTKNSDFIRLLPGVSPSEFKKLLSICDVGLIFLDSRFTIPNFPSRLLSYMNASLPIVAVTDSSTDLKQIIPNENLGYWIESKQESDFVNLINKVSKTEIKELQVMGKNSYNYLKENYTVEDSYHTIISTVNKGRL